MATAKHNNRHEALGYEMGSGHIFKVSCWVPNTSENLAPDSLVPFQKENISILAIVQPALEIILHSYFSKA